MFFKPLAKFMLCKKFWDNEMECRDEANCQEGRKKGVGVDVAVSVRDGTEGNGSDDHSEMDVMMSTNGTEEVSKETSKKYKSETICKRCKARQAALGLLNSYVALIQRESELETAKEKGLLPRGIKWPQWRLFVH